MEDAREARRKRLVNRGSDRLAFITGQLRSLPSAPHPPPPPMVASLPDEVSNQNSPSEEEKDNRKPEIEASNEISTHETGNESVKDETNNYSLEEPLKTLVRCRTTATSGVALKISCGVITPSQISRSISASENIRIFCSVVIALLVVLSYHGNLFSSKSAVGSVINLRPLLLVLLTDVTVVIGRILLNRETEQKGKEGAKISRGQGEGNGWSTDIGKMLEAAMLFKKVMFAVSMDCSICAVIMISGLS